MGIRREMGAVASFHRHLDFSGCPARILHRGSHFPLWGPFIPWLPCRRLDCCVGRDFWAVAQRRRFRL